MLHWFVVFCFCFTYITDTVNQEMSRLPMPLVLSVVMSAVIAALLLTISGIMFGEYLHTSLSEPTSNYVLKYLVLGTHLWHTGTRPTCIQLLKDLSISRQTHPYCYGQSVAVPYNHANRFMQLCTVIGVCLQYVGLHATKSTRANT